MRLTLRLWHDEQVHLYIRARIRARRHARHYTLQPKPVCLVIVGLFLPLYFLYLVQGMPNLLSRLIFVLPRGKSRASSAVQKQSSLARSHLALQHHRIPVT